MAPDYVDRHEDFFGVLFSFLEELGRNNPKIKDLVKVERDTIMP